MTMQEFLENGGWVKSQLELNLEGAGFGFFSNAPSEFEPDYIALLKEARLCAKFPFLQKFSLLPLLLMLLLPKKFFSSNYFPLDRVLVSSLAYNNAGEQISCVAIYIFGRRNLLPAEKYVWRCGHPCSDRALSVVERHTLLMSVGSKSENDTETSK